MQNSSDDRLPVEVFAGNAWEAGLVKSLLENAGIETYMKDEIRGTYFPWHISPGGMAAIKLVVAKADVDKAREVIEEYFRNAQSG